MIRKVGYGGMGEVYLAEDTRLEKRPVAIKILHQRDGHTMSSQGQAGIRLQEKAMTSERQELVGLSHPDIIRVFNYGRHEGAGEFLVLEYANGLTLEEVRVRVVQDPAVFGGPRFHEFVLAYGIRILNALSYLHRQKGKVYGDLKPQNVMHCGTEIKIVDVGSVRQERAEGPTTGGYRAPGVGRCGETRFQDDLFSLGVTLRELSAAAPRTQGLGPESLRRVLRRATHEDRRARFATADEMALQLRGVLRELRSLRTRQESFEPSPLFVQSAHALDGAIGSPPPLSSWAGGGDVPTSPGLVPPEPSEVACGLPVPRADPYDVNAPRLDRLTEDDAAALLQRIGGWDPSTELHLLRCRLHLVLAVTDRDARSMRRAYAEVSRARRSIDARWAPYDWRIDWHRGLLALADGDMQGARSRFDGIYQAIPGEYAPKLALGYCAETQREWAQALELYDAVRRRNHSLGPAAFGYARVRLASTEQEDPALALTEALAALELVPAHSRHLTAARTAIVRIKATRARNPLDNDDEALKGALHRLGPLFHEHGLTDLRARRRLETELWRRCWNASRSGRSANSPQALTSGSPPPGTARTGGDSFAALPRSRGAGQTLRPPGQQRDRGRAHRPGQQGPPAGLPPRQETPMAGDDVLAETAGRAELTALLEVSQIAELPVPDEGTEARMYAVVTVTVQRTAEGGGSPSAAAGDPPGQAVVFLIDHSSSMVNPPARMAAARDAAAAAVHALPDGTRFAIVAGRDRATAVYPVRSPAPHASLIVPDGPGRARADDATRRAAEKALRACHPGGGTAIGNWLAYAPQTLRTTSRRWKVLRMPCPAAHRRQERARLRDTRGIGRASP